MWVLGVSKNQVVYFPKGDLTKGKIICEGFKGDPCHALAGPFHLGIDQQNRIWVTNAFGDFVTRFSADDPSKVETFKAGYSGSGLGIDSHGNVWVTTASVRPANWQLRKIVAQLPHVWRIFVASHSTALAMVN